MGILDKVYDTLKEDSDNDSDPDTINIDFSVLLKNLKKVNSSRYTYFLILIPILLGALWIRTRNLSVLNNKYLLGLDPYYYFRVASTIIEQGSLPAWDYMRLAPIGTGMAADLFVYILVYWYKLLHFINPAITQLQAHILYPAAFGVIGFFFFFLMARELFGNKVALFGTAIFAVIPTYLYRTTAGFADHEAAAMPFLFISLWFFIKLLKTENHKKGLIYAGTSGLFAAAMGFTFGAFPMLTIPIAIFMIFKVLSEKINFNEIKCFTIWNLVFVSFFFISQGLNAIKNISIALSVFATVLFYVYIITKKIKLEFKFKAHGILSIVFLIIISLAINVFAKIINITELIAHVLSPAEATGRVAQTISEIIGSTHFWNNFRWPLALAVIGFIFIIFLMQKEGKVRFITTTIAGVVLYIWTFISITSGTALKLYIIFNIFLFALIYFKLIKEDKEMLFFIAVIVSMNLYLASTAARFLFTVSPFIALLAGYSIIQSAKWFWNNKNNQLKIISLIIILVFAYMTITMGYGDAQGVKYSGSGLAGQWESAFGWIRENTPQDAIITHWWDYGYWTQTVGERASTHDGGTHWEDSLQLLGRYAMTGIDDKNVFTYLKTHNVSYLLYSKEEIGKYHAFSYIGSESNENLDRESVIGMFSLTNVEEIRNGERLIYQGTWGLDQDIVINREVLPKGRAAIVSISIIKENDTFKNPQALIFYNNKRYLTDISCIVVDGERVEFNTNTSLPSCIAFMPAIINQNQVNEFGALIFTSSKVKDGLFARMYLFNQKVDGFEEVYNDGTPLALYQGRLIGPIRIWSIEYPEGTETREDWLI